MSHLDRGSPGAYSGSMLPSGVAIPLADRYVPEPNTGCWLWLGMVDQYGYGRVWHDGRLQAAHRVVYGAVPEGLVLDHKCRVRCCVNPSHLRAVTVSENNLASKPFRRKAVCANGHAMTDENTYTRTDRLGHKRASCIRCQSDRAARYRDTIRRRE